MYYDIMIDCLCQAQTLHCDLVYGRKIKVITELHNNLTVNINMLIILASTCFFKQIFVTAICQ